MIVLFAPDGIGEIGPGSDLATEIVAAVAGDESGPLQSGDIVVVTSKIVSKAEGRSRSATDREAAIDDEAIRTVARRGATRIVRTRHGLTLAAAGVDNSNVAPGTILLLPIDPDASAARLRAELEALTGATLGVVISDTAGRAWRVGQTDQAIGSAGIRVVERYAGQQDAYGNDLVVTAVAVADEIAGAADLVKSKLSHRPVAVIRGLAHHLSDDAHPEAGPPPEDEARRLVRDEDQDLFGYGSAEAVLAAVLRATGQADTYESVLRLPTDESRVAAVLAGSGRTGAEADLLREVLEAGFRR